VEEDSGYSNVNRTVGSKELYCFETPCKKLEIQIIKKFRGLRLLNKSCEHK
jgi:hypothetical protein